jgi:hypothetical protein
MPEKIPKKNPEEKILTTIGRETLELRISPMFPIDRLTNGRQMIRYTYMLRSGVGHNVSNGPRLDM